MTSKLLTRFSGAEGRAAVLKALKHNELVLDGLDLAEEIADASVIVCFEQDEAIIQQGADDQDIYFILAGSVMVERNKRPGPVRFSGSYIGEMSTIDVSVRRSATVRAREQTVLAKVSESAFSALAEKHPVLWRRLAIEVSHRLRQRLEDVPQRNTVSRVFVGSSREALPVANLVAAGLAGKSLEPVIWSKGVFGASQTNIEALEEAIRACDFATLILSADDKVVSRGRRSSSPRDNVLFELGMFMGAVGRSRTFALVPATNVPKMPSDLLGLVPQLYQAGDPPDVADACEELKTIMLKRGPK